MFRTVLHIARDMTPPSGLVFETALRLSVGAAVLSVTEPGSWTNWAGKAYVLMGTFNMIGHVERGLMNHVVAKARVEAEKRNARSFRELAHRLVWQRLPRGMRRKVFFGVTALMTPLPSRTATPRGPIIVVGLLRNTCGLGAGARLCYEALQQAGRDVYGIDITAQIGQSVNLTDYQFRDGSHLREPATIIVHINAFMMPAALMCLRRSLVKCSYVIGYWAWELDKVPDEWMRGVPCVNEVWTTSAFTARALSALLRKDQRLTVVHHPVAVRSALTSIGRQKRSEVRPFTVLSIFELASSADRKNPLGAINAFKTAFGHSPEANLVLKVGSPKVNPGAFKAITEAVANMQNVTLVTDYLTDDQIIALYRDADCYLSLPRSEGFGLTFAEAMLAGLPVVGTAWSGQADFLQDGVAFAVRHRMISAVDDQQTYSDIGSEWADADIDHAAELLTMLADDPALAHVVGIEARAYAERAFGLDAYVKAVSGSLEHALNSNAREESHAQRV